ncbi:hypothetical protein [Algivirga pacifica]|uniref:Uncharacterized protein n=1 Tax=Algivirga pacifica TaxID=1162670 RepID=A0ABP9DPW8_9BACT
MKHKVQIDVVRQQGEYVVCNLYTRESCRKIYMHEEDYQALIGEGFFLRSGKTRDSAGVLNTTHTCFFEEK